MLFKVTTSALPLDLYFFKLAQPLTVFTVQLLQRGKEENLIENHTPFFDKEINTETSSLRTPKIMPRKRNEIVRS